MDMENIFIRTELQLKGFGSLDKLLRMKRVKFKLFCDQFIIIAIKIKVLSTKFKL